MNNDLGYRAELANQVLLRLSRLTEDDWIAILSSAEGAGEFIGLAHELALYAIEVLEEEHGPDARRLVEARLQDAASLFPSLPVADSDATGPISRQILAEGLLLAAMLQDTRGFNHGAVRELSLPFRERIDLADAVRQARASVQPGTDDFSSLSLTPPAPVEPAALPDSKSA